MHIFRFSRSGSARRIPGILFIVLLSAALLCCQKGCAAKKEENAETMEYMENISRFPAAEQLQVPEQEEVLRNEYIYRYNHERMKEKGLTEVGQGEDADGAPGEKYLYLQALYRANLDAYISETLDLKALDACLKNSSLGFVSTKPEEKNLYERESTMGLEFIYIRNNLYIENLRMEQIRLLEEHLKTGEEAVTGEITAMVSETFQEVIKVREPGNWDNTGSFLYPAGRGEEPKIPNQALVLAIPNHEKYDEAGNFLPEDNMKQRQEYLERLKAEKEKEYTQILGACVYIVITY